MDFMLQTTDEFYALILIFHYMCEKYRTEDVIILPPSDSAHLKGSTLNLPEPVLIELREQSAMLCKALERNCPVLLQKYGRGKRMFKYGSVFSVTMCPDL